MIRNGTGKDQRIGNTIFARYLRLTMGITADIRYLRPNIAAPGTQNPEFKDCVCNDRN